MTFQYGTLLQGKHRRTATHVHLTMSCNLSSLTGGKFIYIILRNTNTFLFALPSGFSFFRYTPTTLMSQIGAVMHQLQEIIKRSRIHIHK